MDLPVLILLLFIYLAKFSTGFFITIDADAVECFHDKVNEKTKMGTYQIGLGLSINTNFVNEC